MQDFAVHPWQNPLDIRHFGSPTKFFMSPYLVSFFLVISPLTTKEIYIIVKEKCIIANMTGDSPQQSSTSTPPLLPQADQLLVDQPPVPQDDQQSAGPYQSETSGARPAVEQQAPRTAAVEQAPRTAPLGSATSVTPVRGIGVLLKS